MAERVAIVGAGISGLALAHELTRRNVECVVLEASDRVGGVIRSARVDGHLLEWGPQRARLGGDLVRLVDELGLRDRLIQAPTGLPLFVYRAGRLRRVPFSARELAATDLLSLPAKLRLLAEPFTAAPRDDETVGAAFRRKLGTEAYESLAGPLYGGLYASDPDDMIVGLSLRSTLRDLGVGRSLMLPLLRRRRVATPAAVSFREGLEELPRALQRQLGGRVRLAAPARSIRARDRGFVVEVDGENIDASHVVVTTAAAAAAELLDALVPDAAGRIRQLAYNPLCIVHVHARTALHGMGYQVSLAEDLVTRGVTFNDALFGRSGVYTIYLGGARNPWVADADDARLAEIAVEEFRSVSGVGAEVLSVARARMPAWDRTWRAIAGVELPAGVHLHTNWAARPGLPGRLAGSRRLAERLAGPAA